jgi:anionic cell wall polymer biosynthesis LytR-Cps2A-Psr (LCP) family protein
MDARIPKYCVFDKEKVIRVAGAIGGLKVDVDEKAASALKVSKGLQKLNSTQLVLFLKPSISGTEDFEARQTKVIKALFEGLRSKNIVLTALLAQQLITNLETNFTSGEIMDHYSKFVMGKNWITKEYALPVKKETQNGHVRIDPLLEECKTLLENK